MEAMGWVQESLAFFEAEYLVTTLLEHKVVIRYSVYRWQQYDVIMTS